MNQVDWIFREGLHRDEAVVQRNDIRLLPIAVVKIFDVDDWIGCLNLDPVAEQGASIGLRLAPRDLHKALDLGDDYGVHLVWLGGRDDITLVGVLTPADSVAGPIPELVHSTCINECTSVGV